MPPGQHIASFRQLNDFACNSEIRGYTRRWFREKQGETKMSHTTTRRSLRALALASVALAGITSFASPALAQTAPAADADAGVPDIVVTAQRREESLQDVPLSIVALGSEQLRNADVTEASRLEQLVPGLRLGRSGADPRPAIRGIYTESIQGNADPRVGFYIDEIYQSRTSQTSVPFVDLERVEVQKGPQGTLYGRNSFGGNIAISTAKPSDRLEGGVNLLLGTYRRVMIDGYINVPISESVAVRFAGYAEKRDGFIKSVTAPGFADQDDKNQQYFRGSLRIAPPGSGLEIILRASHWNDDSKGNGTFNAKAIGQFVDPNFVRAPGGTLNVGNATFTFPNGYNGRTFQGQFFPFATFRDGIVDTTINGVPLDLGYPVLGPYLVLNDAPSKQRIKSTQISAVISYDISDSLRLRSITGYNHFDAVRSTDNDGTPANYGIGYFLTKNKAFSQELQLQSTGDGPLSYTVGAYYLNDEVPDGFLSERIRGYSTAGALAGAPGTGSYPLYFGSNFTAYPSSGGAVVNPPTTAYITPNASDAFNPLSWARSITYAAYGQVSYTFNDKLTVTGGLRYTVDKKDLRSALATPGIFPAAGTYLVYRPSTDFNRTCDGVTAADPSSTAAANVVANALTTRCGQNTFKYFTYRIAADYKINDDVMVYASYSTGKHAGGFSYSPISNTAGQPLPPYDTESVQAFEAGLKGTFFDRKLQFNLAAFYNIYSNLQVQTSFPNPLVPNSVITLLSNGAKNKSPGIDLSIVAFPIPKLRLNLAVNYLRSRDDPFPVSVTNNGICGIVAPGGTCTTNPAVQLGYLGGILPNPVSNPELFVPIRDASGAQVVVGGVPQFTALGYNTPTRVQNTPDISAQFGLAYEFDLGENGSITPEVQTLYSGNYLLSRAFPNYLQNAYTKTELRITYRSADSRLSLQAFVDNLENVATIGRVTVASGGGFSGSYAAPRTFGVKIGYKY
jgi:iron complex outermembrane recepter protein